MGHYFSAHSKDLNFFVKCGVNDCPATFRRYHSFYKHVARNHKEEYQSDFGGPGEILRENNDTITPVFKITRPTGKKHSARE